MVPRLRITAVNTAPPRLSGDYVLYWMISARRTGWNFALQRAVEHASTLRKPLLVFEPLRVDHRWASARFHQFVVDGMRDNARAFDEARVAYFPFLERQAGEARGVLQALTDRAAIVVTDDFPCFFLPRMVTAAGASLPVAMEAVDSNGLLPLRAFDAVFPTAYAFRRALQRELATHLRDRPAPAPLISLASTSPLRVPDTVAARWPPALQWLDDGGSVDALPIDARVTAGGTRGGSSAARQRLNDFLASDLSKYGVERNHPDRDSSSRLSPYLHWGHIGAHEVFDAVMTREGWIGDIPRKATGAKEGWWGVSPGAEHFLDELVTWRELGFNFTSKRDDYDRYESLPAWARTSLDNHAGDPREFLYDRDAFERAETHDPLWNAAQRQLITEGRIHGYLRMLWGKKILEWSASPREALETMIELNNKYALDGRDPNSYSGIFWVLGRYDRPWHPERDVFGVIRYMSSDNTARKMRVRNYVSFFAGAV